MTPEVRVGDVLWRMRWVLLDPAKPRGHRDPQALGVTIDEVQDPDARRPYPRVTWRESDDRLRPERHALVGLRPSGMPDEAAAAVVAYHPPTGCALYRTPAAAITEARRQAEVRRARAHTDLLQCVRQVAQLDHALRALGEQEVAS